ncbi:MAG TPA: class I SAM-dependent methyltransferase [Candidatus Sulfotelmatobacter sp.]|nr:class I SAM-dependent methyltransferase [Candidatus Sulfotelmatobacter sp.]
MPILRLESHLDGYKLRAQAEDLHEMAARPNKKPLTEFVNRQILNALQPDSNDFLVDIGCGDATLQRMASATRSVGIVASQEEQQRLQSAYPQLQFIASLAQTLPLETRSATKVVCNAVLHYLFTMEDVKAALSEIARIARPGALIWIGEIPTLDEYEAQGMYRGTSMVGFLWHLLRHNGLRSFLGMIRRLIMATLGNECIVLNSARHSYAEPETMIRLAENSGLRLKSQFRHKEINERGEIMDSRFRYDYIFTV